MRFHQTGVKNFHHPIVGDLSLTYEALEPPGDPGQIIFVYMAEPNSASHEALSLLSSWATTPAQISASHVENEV